MEETNKKDNFDPSFLEYLSHFSELVDPHPLVKDGTLGGKCFSLIGGKVIFGIQLSELPDSHILLLPTMLVHDEDGEVTGKLISPEMTMRLYKGNIGFMINPDLEHRYYYYKFVKSYRSQLPWYFTEARLNAINDILEAGPQDIRRPKNVKSEVAAEKKVIHPEASELAFTTNFESKYRH